MPTAIAAMARVATTITATLPPITGDLPTTDGPTTRGLLPSITAGAGVELPGMATTARTGILTRSIRARPSGSLISS